MLELNKDFIAFTFIIIDDIYHKFTQANIKNRRSIDRTIINNNEIVISALSGNILP